MPRWAEQPKVVDSVITHPDTPTAQKVEESPSPKIIIEPEDEIKDDLSIDIFDPIDLNTNTTDFIEIDNHTAQAWKEIEEKHNSTEISGFEFLNWCIKNGF